MLAASTVVRSWLCSLRRPFRRLWLLLCCHLHKPIMHVATLFLPNRLHANKSSLFRETMAHGTFDMLDLKGL